MSTSIKGRSDDDKTQWKAIIKLIGAPPSPVTMIRIVRHHESAHYGEPRLLRVTFETEKDMETVLSSAYKLQHTEHKARIFPDVPWHLRQRKKNPLTSQNHLESKSIYVHGVPEASTEDVGKIRDHDKEEWTYIMNVLSLENVCATSIFRVPRSPNYQGNGPRIIKVNLLTADMVGIVYQSWRQNRAKFPTELRLKCSSTLLKAVIDDRSTSPTKTIESNEKIPTHYLSPILIESPCPSTKNAPLPIH